VSKKLLFNLLNVVTLVSLVLAACATPTAEPPAATETPLATEVPATSEPKLVGISMPAKTAQWISDGKSMVKELEGMDYKTDLQFADDDISNQLAQIENMIARGAGVLVIAAIDDEALFDVLQQAKNDGVLIIAYDRLISRTANVDYYATFDNYGIGVIQGTQIETALGLKDVMGPFNIELFGGSADDINAFYFYNGAMSVLQPYIDSGKLVVQSGQAGMDVVSIFDCDGIIAQSRMDNLLNTYYTDTRVDAVLSPDDGLSIGIISALKNVGYGTTGQPMPVVTGQDAEVASVKAIIAGEQAYTIFKDTRELARQTAAMVDAALRGKEVPINDTTTYNNGVKIVPSYLLIPYGIDITNYEKYLVESGYYTADQLE
jgi:putative multiple sugar transport system substrate-binding protein